MYVLPTEKQKSATLIFNDIQQKANHNALKIRNQGKLKFTTTIKQKIQEFF